jgi:hypothetical protein
MEIAYTRANAKGEAGTMALVDGIRQWAVNGWARPDLNIVSDGHIFHHLYLASRTESEVDEALRQLREALSTYRTMEPAR